MKKLVLYRSFLIVLFTQACSGSGKQETPAHIMPETRFTNLLSEVRLLEGVYTIDHQQIDNSNVSVGSYYDLLLTRYEVTREQFLESYSFYASNPEVMLRIETKVSEKLDSIQHALVSN
jgi:hypothetical protein